jgi:predicted nucleotidyltransferase
MWALWDRPCWPLGLRTRFGDDGEVTTHLDEAESAALDRYIDTLQGALGDDLMEVWLFGSAARGDMWSPATPHHSDIDILVLTAVPVPEPQQEALINDTYPLFLECGRQIDPQFRTRGEFERQKDLARRILLEGRVIYERGLGTPSPDTPG